MMILLTFLSGARTCTDNTGLVTSFHGPSPPKKTARSRTCRHGRTGDCRKLQPAHREHHHLLEPSPHDYRREAARRGEERDRLPGVIAVPSPLSRGISTCSGCMTFPGRNCRATQAYRLASRSPGSSREVGNHQAGEKVGTRARCGNGNVTLRTFAGFGQFRLTR